MGGEEMAEGKITGINVREKGKRCPFKSHTAKDLFLTLSDGFKTSRFSHYLENRLTYGVRFSALGAGRPLSP
jgi:hypothetical protein